MYAESRSSRLAVSSHLRCDLRQSVLLSDELRSDTPKAVLKVDFYDLQCQGQALHGEAKRSTLRVLRTLKTTYKPEPFCRSGLLHKLLHPSTVKKSLTVQALQFQRKDTITRNSIARANASNVWSTFLNILISKQN
ncbi:hypothetical protein NDU88_003931 [Pleurodeles waltl]|uniref:Uncharacterized protein n=1 Tax=Pleurodeles waltl TaxID=8319 RepID=A0AAV7M8E8_PLEWA|nr:hypothetical protein NDU88_003931 [Pleurodeles waltl]